MQPRWILPVSTLCAGIAFGFIAGKASGDRAYSDDGESAQTRVRPSKVDRLSPESTNAVRSLVAGRLPKGSAALRDYSSFSPAQLAKEIARLEHLPVGERATETLLLFSRWGEVDPLAALAQANAYGVAGEAARCEVLKSWSANDPRAAADWFVKNTGQFAGVQPGRSVSEREIASSAIARAWAKLDPEAALAWAVARGPEAGRCVGSVLGETVLENPALATRLAGSTDASFLKSASGEIAWQWAARDFSAAEQWIRTLPSDCRDSAMAKAIGSLSLSDPEKAAGQLDTLPDGAERDRAVGIVMRQLAKEDTAVAERWLESQAGDATRRAGAISLVSAMAAEDPAGARGLLDVLQPGPARDGAAAAYIRSVSSAKPEDLLELASGLSNDADRGQSIALIITRWRQEDAGAAERYILENFGNAGSGD